ncbi:MAG TPA: 50S ribosomal protein L15 [Candidatus Limnocylindrales bacterium]|nr:50S ribosomal protein L15 [Candidatus Limnocylindrales bacterium]
MKLHDLKPAPGSHTARTRVGRGIAAGKGKTAGRGTKGQKARAGGSIPPWFEGGQTPLHMRIPKLRGFKNRFKVDYEVVNIGAIAERAAQGAFESAEPAGGSKAKTPAPITINQEILRAVGLVRTIKKPLKILGTGELSTPFFVVADAFTKSAVSKIEAAGGTVSVLEVPAAVLPALGVGEEGERAPRTRRTAEGRAAADRDVAARANRDARAAEDVAAKAATPKPKKAASARAEAGTPETASAEEAEMPVAEAADAPAEADAAEAVAPAAADENA